jgi:16S rRNA (uracil1498-N3)-methyltransferase
VHSFYLSPEDWKDPFILTGREANHLLKVKRARPGDELRLFDGQGREGVFLLDRHDRNSAHLVPIDVGVLRRPEREVHLALGWNKTARRGWLLEKSVELNVAGLVFWQADKSQGRVPETPKSAWHDQCIAAAKQCGNPWLPSLKTAPGGAREIIDTYSRCDYRGVLWEGQNATRMLDPDDIAPSGQILLVLGPEGGLASHEVNLFQEAGFALQSLGRSVLRWETAALLCLGLLYWQGEKHNLTQSEDKPGQ